MRKYQDKSRSKSNYQDTSEGFLKIYFFSQDENCSYY